MDRLTYYSLTGSKSDCWRLRDGVTQQQADERLVWYENEEHARMRGCDECRDPKAFLELSFAYCPFCGRKLEQDN